MGTGFSKKKKQAKMLQQQLASMQEQMKNTSVTGVAGNGLVEVSLNGDNELQSIKIKPECVDPEDVEGLQDLILAAHKDATDKLKNTMPQMDDMMGGMGGFPGMPNLGSFGGGFPGL